MTGYSHIKPLLVSSILLHYHYQNQPDLVYLVSDVKSIEAR